MRCNRILLAASLILPGWVLVGCDEERPFEESEPASTSAPIPFEHPEVNFAPSRSGPTYEIEFYLPGEQESATLTYEEIDGLAVFEGDIILGQSEDLQQPRTWNPEPVCVGDICSKTQAISLAYGKSFFWLDGVIPYEIDPRFDDRARAGIEAGIELLAGTNLSLQPRDGERDYIVFVPTDDNWCSAVIGRQIGGQNVTLMNPGLCGEVGVAHEILHAAGLFHEQSRTDRDGHVRILRDNIQPGKGHNFETHTSGGVDVGPYDLQSIMHYGPRAFGILDPTTGAQMTTIEARNPGETVGGATGLSTHDLAGLNVLYPDSNEDRYLAIPGLVYGLRHTENQANDVISDPVLSFGDGSFLDVDAERIAGGDLGAPLHEGFEWWMVPTDTPLWSLRIEEIPPGVVMGMFHSENMPSITSDPRLTTVSGGDLGAPLHVGFVWTENTSLDHVNWDVVDFLPPYTVVGLKHSVNQPDKTFQWSDGQTYDPLVSCPSGFDRKSGGDLGAPSGQGFYWCEKL